MADPEAPAGHLDDLRHVPVLGGELGELPHAAFEVQAGEPRRVLRLDARGAALEELLQLRLVQELDQVAGQLAVAVREALARRRGQRVNVLGPAATVSLGVNRRQALGLQRLEVVERPLLGNLEVGGNLGQGRLAAALQKGEDDVAPGVHEPECYEFFKVEVEIPFGPQMRHLALALAAVFALVFAVQASAADAAWKPLAHVTGVVDIGGPRTDGKLVVAGAAKLWLMDLTGALTPFAQGGGGYSDDKGAESYLAVSPGLAVDGAGCSFAPDDVYILRLHSPIGITKVSAGGVKSDFANIALAGLTGIAFDTTGLFKHRLLVTGVTKGGTRDLVAIDCNAKQFILNGALPVNEGGFAVAPATFGAFAGALIAPDELSGKIYAFGADGTVQTVVDSGLPHGADVGVESLGFVPRGFLRGGTLLFADRATPGGAHPGSDSVLTLSAADLVASAAQEGDLLAATEGGGQLIAVRCATSCQVIPIVAAATKAHGEGHLVLVTTAPPPSPSPTSPPPTPAAAQPGSALPDGIVIAALVIAVGVAAAAVVLIVLDVRRRAS